MWVKTSNVILHNATPDCSHSNLDFGGRSQRNITKDFTLDLMSTNSPQ